MKNLIWGVLIISLISWYFINHERHVIRYNNELQSWVDKGSDEIDRAWKEYKNNWFNKEKDELDLMYKFGAKPDYEYKYKYRKLVEERDRYPNMSTYWKIRFLMKTRLPDSFLIGNRGIFHKIKDKTNVYKEGKTLK